MAKPSREELQRQLAEAQQQMAELKRQLEAEHDARGEGEGIAVKGDVEGPLMQGERIVGGDVGGDVDMSDRRTLQKGKYNINIGEFYARYETPQGKGRLSKSEFGTILLEYMSWVQKAYAKARLYGLESIRTAKGRPVRSLADVFVPITLRRFSSPTRREVEQAAKAFGDDPLAEQRAYLLMADQRRGEGKLTMLSNLLIGHDRLAIIGGAGCGKSTLLEYLASMLAEQTTTGGDLPFSLPENRDTLAPLLIPLRYYRQYREDCKASPGHRLDDPRAGTLAGFIPWYLKKRSPALKLSEDFFDRLLLGGGCLLMLDGLDEVVSKDERGWVRQQVQELANNIYPGNVVVVTAREAGYRENAVFDDDFVRLDVQPLHEQQIETLVHNWCQQLYPEAAEQQTTEIVKAIAEINRRYRNQELPALIDTPLMTTMVVSVKWGETELPRERAKLYEAAVKVILQAQYIAEDETRHELINWGGPWEEQREWLSHLAWAMHGRGKDSAAITKHDLREILKPLLPADTLDQFIRAVRGRGGLLEERAELFQFVHLTFQEFLAARLLVKQRKHALAGLLTAIPQAWWREVFLLMYGFAKMDYAPYADEFLNWLSDPPEADGATRLAGLELAAAAVLEIERPDPALRKRQADRLAQAIIDAKTHTPALLRETASRTLARLGDPRSGVGLNEQGLPAIEWSDLIEPGPFMMGNTMKTDEMAYDNEAPQFQCTLIRYPYYISRYPITVAQYQAFISAGGYEQCRYWTEAGWEWNKEKGISRPQAYGEPYNFDNHAQVGVSWYEAAAFCSWLCEQSGQEISLPTEAQWERAARHTDARRYPWGKEPPKERCNMIETGIGSTCAVGMFPHGDASCGAADMSGNVWEWCSTKWRGDYQNYEKVVDDDLVGDGRRVLRGGSFGGYDGGVRCAFRSNWLPRYRDDGVGFRVVF
ncbi:MAG: SUMF1/EgtB/PvdO family nonheme iron enzyme, partial [Chloroflexi bacterium]|nr:SUMF1/EgtB/PvdO family nonheme iron enzyme [Chloroflexota bacterium]